MENYKNRNIISVDAETNGLRGKAFMIAGVAYRDGKEISRFVGRCPIEGEVNPWVKENVLTKINEIPITHGNYKELLKDFVKWHNKFPQWNSWDAPDGFQTIWHLGQVVEVQLFRDAYDMGLIGEFDSPYVPIELGTLLQSTAHRPDSVDEYIEKYGLQKPDVPGGTHNALYDALAAATAYFDLIK